MGKEVTLIVVAKMVMWGPIRIMATFPPHCPLYIIIIIIKKITIIIIS